ncbi:MAG: GNAT family N-acetyltransferase [Rubrivivax sp.]
MSVAPGWTEAELSAVEDAGLNASAPPQQRWVDGWLVRLNPGKAKRARCVNALAAGRRPLDEKLTEVQRDFDAAGLAMVVRITPFTAPAALDADLDARGFLAFDDTCVLAGRLHEMALHEALPPALALQRAAPEDYADIVGALRGSGSTQRRAHAQRLLQSPVPYDGFVLRRGAEVLACGQTAREGRHVGLYDVFTAEAARSQGLSRLLCAQLLRQAAADGARVAYLQVDAGNTPALRVYRRLGFVDAYRYHYRARDPGAA